MMDINISRWFLRSWISGKWNKLFWMSAFFTVAQNQYPFNEHSNLAISLAGQPLHKRGRVWNVAEWWNAINIREFAYSYASLWWQANHCAHGLHAASSADLYLCRVCVFLHVSVTTAHMVCTQPVLYLSARWARLRCPLAYSGHVSATNFAYSCSPGFRNNWSKGAGPRDYLAMSYHIMTNTALCTWLFSW